MRPLRHLLVPLALVAAMTASAHAVEPDEMLQNPALEARARAISESLRCLVCQNESIDDSHAALAHDLRVLVRKRLEAGDTDEEVRDYLVARYGQFILLRPPFEMQTLLLWGTPILVLLGGGLAILVALKRRPVQPRDEALNEAERERLKAILNSRDA